MVVEIRTNKVFYNGRVIFEKAAPLELAEVIEAAAAAGLRGKINISTTTGEEIDGSSFPYNGDVIVTPVALAG